MNERRHEPQISVAFYTNIHDAIGEANANLQYVKIAFFALFTYCKPYEMTT